MGVDTFVNTQPRTDSTPIWRDCETGVVSVMIELRAPFALLGTHLREDMIETDLLKEPGTLAGRSWNLFLVKAKRGSSLGPSASGGGSALGWRGFRLIRSGASYGLRGS